MGNKVSESEVYRCELIKEKVQSCIKRCLIGNRRRQQLFGPQRSNYGKNTRWVLLKKALKDCVAKLKLFNAG